MDYFSVELSLIITTRNFLQALIYLATFKI